MDLARTHSVPGGDAVPNPADRAGHAGRTAAPEPTAEQVADLLEAVADANGWMAIELDGILSSRAAVSQATVDRFSRLAEQLRPGASARARLSNLDPDLLLAATSLWMSRRQPVQNAAARAQMRWTSRPADGPDS
jgi:hypothetical protein